MSLARKKPFWQELIVHYSLRFVEHKLRLNNKLWLVSSFYLKNLTDISHDSGKLADVNTGEDEL